MNNFDKLYQKIMESMIVNSVYTTPQSNISIGDTGNAIGVKDDKAYAKDDTRIPKFTFPLIQTRNKPIKRRNSSKKK